MEWSSPRIKFVLSLALATLVSLVLFAYWAWRNHSLANVYLGWNLMLAWIPLLLAVRLTRILSHKRWSSWEAIAITLLWLGFLPNSFYMISDFIHLQDIITPDVLYDAIMFTSFIYTGVVLGFSSLCLVHVELLKRLKTHRTTIVVGIILFLCSFALYIGRDLRWNTWDILFNPAGLLFDISERFLYPGNYPQMFLYVISFFALLASMYTVAWQGIRMLVLRRLRST